MTPPSGEILREDLKIDKEYLNDTCGIVRSGGAVLVDHVRPPEGAEPPDEDWIREKVRRIDGNPGERDKDSSEEEGGIRGDVRCNMEPGVGYVMPLLDRVESEEIIEACEGYVRGEGGVWSQNRCHFISKTR